MSFPKIYDLRRTKAGNDVFIALVCIDAGLFSRVGRQGFVSFITFLYFILLFSLISHHFFRDFLKRKNYSARKTVVN